MVKILTEPGYLALARSGELNKRAEQLEARLVACDICPRACKANRQAGKAGYCHSGALPVIASICAHRGEEPPISGTRGSGTVFFANCNMRCVYCQNYQISQKHRAMGSNEITTATLAKQMIYLQDELDCHNINFVSPSHFVPQLVRAVCEAVPWGLKIPLIYNTSGYDSVDIIKALDGIVDIYLPDIRYSSEKLARKYSRTNDYVANARAAIKEMYLQVGNLITDDDGIAIRGIVVRHLILPQDLAGSEASLAWLVNEVSPEITVSIMSQYYPTHDAFKYPELSRRITPKEYEYVTSLVDKLGIEDGWIQELDAADHYQPDFEREGHPFKS